MAQNQVRNLRKHQRLTIAQLAEKAGISPTYLTRIEGGTRGLSVPVAERIAVALQTAVEDVLGLTGESASARGNGGGFSEDVAIYEPSTADAAPRAARGEHVIRYIVKTAVLDKVGIRPGDVLFIDVSARAVEALNPLQIVIAQAYDSDELLNATTVLRQFVPPDLLITNSSASNEAMLALGLDAMLRGVVTGSYRPLRV